MKADHRLSPPLTFSIMAPLDRVCVCVYILIRIVLFADGGVLRQVKEARRWRTHPVFFH